jgi:hypothetical protein
MQTTFRSKQLLAALSLLLGSTVAFASPQYVFQMPSMRVTSAVAEDAALTFDKTSLEFGQNWVSLLSAEQVVLVANPGTTPKTVGGASITTGAGSFRITNECGIVAPGGSCRVLAMFAPNAAGTATGTLAINTDSGTTNVALSGTGRTPVVSLSTPVIADSYETMNEGVARLFNDGFQPITVTMPLLNRTPSLANFTWTTTCGRTLAAGDSCDTRLKLMTNVVGSRTGTLNIGTSAGTKSVPVAAARYAGALSFPSTLYFGTRDIQTTSQINSATVKNTGSAPLNITSITMGSGSAFQQSNNCGGTLAVGQSCQIDVLFTPTAVGPVNDVIYIGQTGAGGSILHMALEGIGAPVVTSIAAVPKAGPNGGNIELSWSTIGLDAFPSDSVQTTCPGATSFTALQGQSGAFELSAPPGAYECQLEMFVGGTRVDTYTYRFTVP